MELVSDSSFDCISKSGGCYCVNVEVFCFR